MTGVRMSPASSGVPGDCELVPAKSLDVLFHDGEWIDGTPVSDMDDGELMGNRAYAMDRISHFWYWREFLSIVDGEMASRGMVMHPDSYWEDSRMHLVHPRYH